ncbi:hypothetical protein MHYP_G00314520 [Metynnis hypsauchen]
MDNELQRLQEVEQLQKENERLSTAQNAASWDEAFKRAFQSLKDRLTSAPVLAYADFSEPFIVEVDASHGGLGAVLSQEHEGKVHPIAFASRGLRPTE